MGARETNRAPGKYRAIRVELDGITFASKREARRYQELKILEGGRLLKDLSVHPRFKIVVNDVHVCTYVGDFQYWCMAEQAVVVEDVKGMRRGKAYEMFRLKAALMKAIYKINVREV